MPSTGTHDHAIGQLQGTVTGLQSTLDTIRRESREDRERHLTTVDQVLDRCDRNAHDVGEVTRAVAVLAKTVDTHREMTVINFESAEKHNATRFASIWRWIAPAGGVGAALGAGGLAWKMLAG